MIAMQERDPRLGWMFVLLVALALVALGLPSRMLTGWTYAVERGKLRANSEELATTSEDLAHLQDVSHAFRLVAKVARPGVAHIRVSRDEAAHDRIVELNREQAELSEQLDVARTQLGSEAAEQPPAEDIIEAYVRLREIAGEIEVLSERLAPGSGSGIIFDRDGYILTNNHVIEGRGAIRVILPDEREYEATLIGSDPKTDLAVIKIDTVDLHPLDFGDSDQMEVGDWVIAVGAPFGLSQTVTHGIVSATGRNDVSLGRGIIYRNFLQTDAEINPGNSGGPLLNLRGEVIGVNTAIATRADSRYNAGIAFTIPSNTAVKIAAGLKESGRVARGWLGIILSELSEDDVELFGLRDRQGVLVDTVFADSPAKRAGLLCEDVILAVGGIRTGSAPAVQAVVADTSPGETAEITVRRDGHEETVRVKLGLQPDNVEVVPRNAGTTIARELKPLALKVRSMRTGLSNTIFRNSGSTHLVQLLSSYEQQRGVFVLGVGEPVDGKRPDIEPGELIVAVNGQSVSCVAALAQLLETNREEKTFNLDIVGPDGQRRTVEYKPG